MLSAVLILVLSAALFLFYLQAICERILRRHFAGQPSHPVVDANRLEFPFVQKALEEFDLPVDYPRFRMQLKCDYLALTYLLKNSANQHHRLSRHELLLAIYFHSLGTLLAVAHLAGISEKPVLLKMTGVLEYFANVLGERIRRIPSGELSASEYLMGL